MSGKTEWEDALIKHGIIPKPPDQPTQDDLYLESLEKLQQRDPFENKTLDELNELEDDVDDDILDRYRQQRMAEMMAQSAKNKFGQYTEISEDEFKTEVTQASNECHVIVHLFAPSLPACKLINQHLEVLARKFRAIKFVKIVAQKAIHNWPESNCPTLLVYHKTNIVAQFVGIGTMGGLTTTPQVLEWLLAQGGVLQTDLEEDPRRSLKKVNISRGPLRVSHGHDSEEENDD
eukprot:TRINITY_DN16458_c0_g1_i3.p1 TRINITY_DN16458_c0_g1~~TRINITY_DN16458_c0_g1_i3.p1  ORF type:complete len:233 (-),score=74.71 TRINITY_DN16458_c0_g1_i3:89-787(-)